MENREGLFRKTSLERLSSPEQLDQLMQITTPKSWIALSALGVMLVFAILWSIFGKIPTNVNGVGVLIRPGGVFSVESRGSGPIIEYYVHTGEQVQKGQKVAHIDQPDIENQILKAKAVWADLKKQSRQSEDFDKKNLELQLASIKKEDENLNYSVKITEEKLKWLKEKIETQEKLAEQGLITKQALQTTKETYFQTQDELQKVHSQLKQVTINENNLIQQIEQRALDHKIRIQNARRDIKLLQNQLKENSDVISHHHGHVISILYDAGQMVSTGTPILSMELTGEGEKNLEALVYVDPAQGKRIKMGMLVEVSPSTVKKEEYGFMIGRVTRVSGFPITRQEMMRMLKNEDLVQSLSGHGAPYEIQVELMADVQTPSGYHWSSGNGPPEKIHSGTLCGGQITVEKQRPIALVIPVLKKFFGLE